MKEVTLQYDGGNLSQGFEETERTAAFVPELSCRVLLCSSGETMVLPGFSTFIFLQRGQHSFERHLSSRDKILTIVSAGDLEFRLNLPACFRA